MGANDCPIGLIEILKNKKQKKKKKKKKKKKNTFVQIFECSFNDP